MGQGPEEIVDRLLISALIEARSCERFGILGRRCKDPSLATFYKGLYSAEYGHYSVFLGLAEQVLPKKIVRVRWESLLEEESKIIQNQPAGPGLHSGISKN
jgi:tRNA-(ms[2]io[6]A)-hydroxylase